MNTRKTHQLHAPKFNSSFMRIYVKQFNDLAEEVELVINMPTYSDCWIGNQFFCWTLTADYKQQNIDICMQGASAGYFQQEVHDYQMISIGFNAPNVSSTSQKPKTEIQLKNKVKSMLITFFDIDVIMYKQNKSIMSRATSQFYLSHCDVLWWLH